MSRRALSRALARRARRGFTLIELLVALGLTAVVATGLYALAMVSSQTFQTQQRISEMQMRLRAAMEWIRSDVQRAGYLSSPNATRDPMVCPRPAGLPIQTMIAEAATRPANWPAENNQISPTRLTLIGNYASTDEYPIQGVVGTTVYLQNHSPSFVRVTDSATFSRIFLNNVVRLRGNDGRMQFGTVTSVNYVAATTEGTMPTLTLATAPTLAGGAAGTGTAGCGLTGFATGATVAPVTAVQYRIQDVSGVLPGTVSANAAYNVAKADLVREDFQLSGAGFRSVPNTLRSVMEYAADFNIAGIFDSAGAGAAEPRLTRYDFGDPTMFSLLSDATANAASQPHLLRALGVRLSSRDRVEDLSFGWVARALPTDPLTRFKVVSGTAGAARVRTLQAEIQLSNVSYRVFR